MIFVKFDKYGALDFIDLQNETIYKGSNRVNRLFVTFDEIDYKTSHYLTFSALVNEKDYGGNLTDLASAKSTYIYNGVSYHGYTFWLFSNLTAQAGTLKLSVRLVDRDTDRVLVSGILPLIVQDTAISTYATVNITTTQYQALLTAFDELSQKIDESNFKTINEESVMGSGDIQLPTYNYVDSRFNNVEDKNAELNKIIARQDKRIKQLELASDGNILYTITESDFGFTTVVSVDTLPFVEIDKIGGMTYKSENLLVLNDVDQTTTNGITYSIKDGVITLNGTASVTTPIVFDTNSYNVNSGLLVWFTSGIINTGNVIIQYYNADTQSWGQVTANSSGNQSLTNINITSIRIYMYASYSYTNVVIKPMLVNGSTAPTTFKQGFEGLRNSAVTGVTSVGANLLNPDEIAFGESSATLQSDGSYISTSLLSYQGVKINTYYNASVGANRSQNGFDMSAETYYVSLKIKINSGSGRNLNAIFFTRESSPQVTGTWITKPSSLTNYYQLYKAKVVLDADDKVGIFIQLDGNSTSAIIQFKDIMIAKEDIDYKPYKKPITTPIPIAIQSLDGYGMGINDTYSNYVDFENKKFVKGISSYTFTGNEGFGQANTNTSGVYRYFTEVLKNLAVGVNASNVKGALLMADLKTATADETYLCNDGVCIDSNGRLYFFKSDIQSASDMTNYLKGKTIYYALLTPTETDISDLIDDDLIVEVESGGQIMFDNEYKQDVLFTWTYQEKM